MIRFLLVMTVWRCDGDDLFWLVTGWMVLPTLSRELTRLYLWFIIVASYLYLLLCVVQQPDSFTSVVSIVSVRDQLLLHLLMLWISDRNVHGEGILLSVGVNSRVHWMYGEDAFHSLYCTVVGGYGSTSSRHRMSAICYSTYWLPPSWTICSS